MRVVVGVRRRDEEQVERQADPVSADLHVALFQDVEQGDLDRSGRSGSSLTATMPRFVLGIRP